MRLKRYLKENLLLEKTFNISKDVKFIYDKGFKDYIDSLVKNKYKKSNFPYIDNKIVNGENVTLTTLYSDQLLSKESKRADKVNPIVIACGIYSDGNYYKPKEMIGKNEGLIKISLHQQVLKILFTNQEDLVPDYQRKAFYQENRSEKIRSTIAHEISHWLNDTLHNFHISNMLKTARELQDGDFIKLKKHHVDMTHFEIDAQIHGIKQLKMSNKKVWDKLELKDLFLKYTALRTVGASIYSQYGKEVGDIWQKTLIKRLVREKLLGKNMRKFAKYPKDFRD